jgi:hypothetical protein
MSESEKTTRDQETIEMMQVGWDMLAQYGKMITMLPLEDWLAAIDKADALAPFVDPTLWMRGHDKMAEIRKIIEAAMPLKRAILALQPKLRAELEREGKL